MAIWGSSNGIESTKKYSAARTNGLTARCTCARVCARAAAGANTGNGEIPGLAAMRLERRLKPRRAAIQGTVGANRVDAQLSPRRLLEITQHAIERPAKPVRESADLGVAFSADTMRLGSGPNPRGERLIAGIDQDDGVEQTAPALEQAPAP